MHFILFFNMKHATATGIHCGAPGVGTVGLCRKCGRKAAHCVLSSTFFVSLHHLFEFFFNRHASKQIQKEPKVMGGPCYICEKKGCQMACLDCNVAFHAHCGKHDICPNAPVAQSDNEQDMHRVGL